MSTRCSALIVALGADEQRAAAALVVGRERHELEDPLDVAAGEAGLEQPLGRRAAHEPLRARAGVDAERLDADDAPDARRRRGGDPDQRRDLLRRQAGDRRAALERVLRPDLHLGPQRVLAPDDVRGDVLGQRLDEERLADHDLVDRLAEDLGEARHVDALLGGIEVDGAGDLGGERLLAPLVPDPDRLLDAGHAGAGQADPNLGRRGLQIADKLVPGGAPSGRTVRDGRRRPLRPHRLARLPRPAHAARDGLRVRADAERGGELDEQSLRFVAMISQASEQMTTLLDELGVAARIEGGRFEPGLARPTRSRSRRPTTSASSRPARGETIETEAAAVARGARGARGRRDPLRPGRAGDVARRRPHARCSARSPRRRAGRARRRGARPRRARRAHRDRAARRLARARRRDAARPALAAAASTVRARRRRNVRKSAIPAAASARPIV